MLSLRSYIGREPARLRAVRRSPFPGVLAALVLAWPLASCATGGVKFDLDPARTAVAEARQAGAPTRSAEAFARAEKHLQEAEALEAGRSGRRDRRGAQRAADLAIVEAHCATALSRALRQTEQTTTKAAAQVAASTAEVDRLTARIKKMEEDQHRLEERLAVLTRDLEVTETELIRTKARLKGNETKAEASAACIAQADVVVVNRPQSEARPPSPEVMDALRRYRGSPHLTIADVTRPPTEWAPELMRDLAPVRA